MKAAMAFRKVASLVAGVAILQGTNAEPAITQALVDEINSKQSLWEAHVPARFANAELDVVKALCGTILKGKPGYNEVLEPKESDGAWATDIPAEFDVRTNWPNCASVSGHIRDQSSCGSCWAFGSTEAFNDRHCIASGGDTTLFSPTDTLSNCGLLQCFSMGCNGGQPGQAWHWFTTAGVVSGGDFSDKGKGLSCAPYPFAPCAHHVAPSPEYPACPSSEYSTPPGFSLCSEVGYGQGYAADKKKASACYSLSGVANIQKDIMQYGSVTGAFTVYSDFPTYKSGVYKHTSGSELGGHAIRIFGWGTENGTDYWLVANSWNDQWGDKGTFKILRGSNECGIEGQVAAGTASKSDANIVV